MKYTFKTKILFVMITLILVPSVLLSIFIMNSSNTFYKESINPSLEQDFKNDLNRIESFFSDSQNELNLYSSIIGLNNNEEYIFSILNQFLENNPTFINSYFTTETGEDYLDHNRKPAVDGRDRVWYKDAKNLGFTILEPYVDALSDEWVVTLSIPVYKEKRFYGVLGVDFLISDIVKDISKVTDVTQTQIVVKNLNNEIIYIDDSFENIEAAEAQLLDTDNPQILNKNYTMDTIHLNLHMIYSSSHYNSSIKKIGFEMASILLFAGILTVVLALSSSKLISVPLNDFKDAIHHISETHEAYSSGHDITLWDKEFIELFEKFNILIKRFDKDKELLTERYSVVSKKNSDLLDKNMQLEDMFKNQKQLDRRIRKSQETYQSILNNINGMIWVLDNQGKIVFVNILLETILGYDEGTLLQQSVSRLINNEYDMKFTLFDMLKSRDYKKIELNMVTASQNIILVEGTTSRVHNDEGELIYIYGICHDIRNSKALYYDYNVKIQEQNLIMDLTETASMNMSLHQVMKSIFDKINNIFGWSAATIRFLNENNEFELISRTSFGNDFIVDHPVPYENTCLGYTIEKKEILSVYEIDQLPVEEPIYKHLIETGYAIVFIPVGNNDIGKGVITITVEKKVLLEREETLNAFTNTIIIVVERALIYEKLKKDYIRMIKVLAEAGDDKDFSSVGHSNRVSEISRKIGEYLFLDDDEVIDLEICGLLHDIGKIGISDQYLSLEAQQTIIGKEKIKQHPAIGKKMLEGIGLSDNILDGIELHHINYDLSGYPEITDIEIIPLFARIIRVADQFDNMSSSNRYESSLDIWFEMAMDSGIKYCPQIIKGLKEVIDKKLI
ncbi:MAG: HD domain-containing protein [Clostridiales bacterium]|nr:HD domain-containing protein [Clostridiales bacterium]